MQNASYVSLLSTDSKCVTYLGPEVKGKFMYLLQQSWIFMSPFVGSPLDKGENKRA